MSCAGRPAYYRHWDLAASTTRSIGVAFAAVFVAAPGGPGPGMIAWRSRRFGNRLP